MGAAQCPTVTAEKNIARLGAPSCCGSADKHCRHDRRLNRRFSSAVKPADLPALDKHGDLSGAKVAEKVAKIGPSTAGYAAFTIV
jgi:hypothetical protein